MPSATTAIATAALPQTHVPLGCALVELEALREVVLNALVALVALVPLVPLVPLEALAFTSSPPPFPLPSAAATADASGTHGCGVEALLVLPSKSQKQLPPSSCTAGADVQPAPP